MKKIIVIPDSFKGTMNSKEICEIMKEVIIKHDKEIEVCTIPVADGGEGSVESFLEAMQGERVSCLVKGPLFEEMEGFYGRIGENTAVIEMAVCSGLPLVEERKNPMLTTTYGVGELIQDAIDKGARKIIVGLGGSCTNDGGTGAAAALGVKFYNSAGETFIPTGGTLSNIMKIDPSECLEKIKDVELVTMCDIDNPLFGENGAAYIFGPQKGADTESVEALDKGLRHLAYIVESMSGKTMNDIPGAGAAGGMGFGMIAFFKSTLQMGIETVLDTVKFDELLQGADLVLTGEGKIDSQSLNGKVIMGIAKRAKKQKVPTIAVVGAIGEGVKPIYDIGVNAIISINTEPVDFDKARYKSQQNLYTTIDNLMRILQIASN